MRVAEPAGSRRSLVTCARGDAPAVISAVEARPRRRRAQGVSAGRDRPDLRPCCRSRSSTWRLSRYPNNIYVAGLILAAAAVGLAPLALGRQPLSSAPDATRSSPSMWRLSAPCLLLRRSAAAATFLRTWSFSPAAANTTTSSWRSPSWRCRPLSSSGPAFAPCSVLPAPRPGSWPGWTASSALAICRPRRRAKTFLPSHSIPTSSASRLRVNEGVVLALVTCIAALAVHRARNCVRAHAAAEAERSRIQQLFGRYVPAQVAEQLIDAGQLAPQQREASIIFADIEGFTRLSESLPPAQVIGMLNSFFSAATEVVDRAWRRRRQPCRRRPDRRVQCATSHRRTIRRAP